MVQLSQFVDLAEVKALIKESLQEFFTPVQETTQASNNDLPDTMGIKETAQLTSYSVSYLYELKEKNAIPYHQKESKGKITFSRKEILAWMNKGRPNVIQTAIDNLAIADIKSKKR